MKLTHSDHDDAIRESPRAVALRERILDNAEKQLREYGYAKSTMADIASSLGMSVGNIYRCFESKRELNEALADRMLLAIRVTAQTIAEDRSASAEDRLRRMARAFYEYNRAQFTGDRRAFEIVAIAIGECWKPVRVHLAKIDRMIEMVIAEGVGRDEFRLTDVTAAAQCVRTIVVNFADPVLMSRQPKNMPPDLEQVLDFILAGLKNLG